MSETEIYLYSSCTSCRNAEALLRDLGEHAMRRDYFRDRFTRDELVQLLNRAGRTPFDVLSTRSKPYKALDLANRDVSNDELLDLMVEHPQLLKRPLIVREGRSTIGFNRSAIEALIKG